MIFTRSVRALPWPNSYRLLRIMKLTVFLSFVLSFSAFAVSNAQKITLNAKNTTLRAAMKEIQKQQGYSFFFRGNDIAATRIDVSIKQADLTDALDQLLRGQNLQWYLEDGTIVIAANRIATKDVRSVQQQDHEVSGNVIDEEGNPLEGVTVTVKGIRTAVTTDANGNYRLTVEGGAALVFSMVGYEPLEQAVSGRRTLNVTLITSVSDLDEVVVVGYGTQRKANVVGSVSQIGSEAIENRPVTQATHAITGQMPGVTVTVASGRPGANPGTVRVRGVGSFGATPDALVLIDGIPGSLPDINPEDIQSISVLKDASSAAIYGARSANGVILVTTKSGSANQLNIHYNGYVGMNEATELPDFVDSWDYAAMYNIASGSNSFTAEDIEKFRSQSDPDNYPNTKFLEELFSRNGVQHGHTLNLNGGNDRTRYFLSGAYMSQDGIIPKNSYQRYNIRLNMDNDLGSNFRLTTRLSGSFEDRKEPQATANRGGELTNQLIQQAVRYPAIHLGQASNGDYGIGPESAGTSISSLASKSYLYNPDTRIGSNIKLDWTPIKALRFSAIGGYNLSILEEKSYRASMRLNDQLTFNQSDLTHTRDKQVYKTMQFIGEYQERLGETEVGVLLGYAFENEQTDGLNGFRQNFPSNDYTVISMGGADNQQVNGVINEWAIQSLFARFKFSHLDRYLFESNLRYDGSSRFPEDNKYALFPSVAVGWRLSQESFMESASSWMSELKLKASWGVLGNQNIGNYPYQVVLNSGRNYPFGGNMTTGAAYWTYKDAGIRWESTETVDVGLESAFFNNKLALNVTYFRRHTRDILFQPTASVSSILGVQMSETNTGEAQNTGWEFDASYRNKIGALGYSLVGNFSIINNKVITLGLGNVLQPNGMVGNGTNLFIGYPMQLYYGYLSDGVFLDDTDITAWADQSAVTPNPRPGDFRYRDISGPDGVPDGKITPNHDRTYLGSRIPKYTFGLNLGLNYRDFDASVLFQGVSGVNGELTGYAGYAFFNLGNIQRWQMEGRFDPANPTRYPDYPRLEEVSNSGTPNTVTSDFWVLDASYLRIKNLQLGYTIPEQLLAKAGISKVRLYFSLENPKTWSGYRQGWDPEISTGGSYYPVLATYTFGCNFKF